MAELAPQTVICDFETFFTTEYSLGRMTTREYILDPRFEVIGASIAVDDKPAGWYDAKDLALVFASFNWDNVHFVAHNTMFDGAILQWRYGHKPKFWYDTMGMAQATLAATQGGAALKKIAHIVGRGKDSQALLNMRGVRGADVDKTSAAWARYTTYANEDSETCRDLFNMLKPVFPKKELLIIDTLLRMYFDNELRIDPVVVAGALSEAREETRRHLNIVGTTKEQLRSREAFANLLKSHGVTPPTKTSTSTGETTYAFAKNDLAFTKLLEHENPKVVALVEAKLNVSSSIEETRAQRFNNLCHVGGGRLNVPLRYSAAHTHRFGGSDRLNLQNLPRTSALRDAIVAPPGYSLVVVDASQIEARMLAWYAGCTSLTGAFAAGEDVYSSFASTAYGRPVNKSDNPEERFVGKTCLGADTRVLTRRGWLPIVDVLPTDELWDGIEWVKHQGVSFMGVKPTIDLHGLQVTPDHEILTEHSWLPAATIHANSRAFQSALYSATLPLSAMNSTSPVEGSHGAGGHSSLAKKIWATAARLMPFPPASSNSKPVYDIVNAGPRNRFTVMTNQGPIIAHNCVLGLGYGTGWAKFQWALLTSPFYNGTATEDFCQNAVTTYRSTYPEITQFWKRMDHALHIMAHGQEWVNGPITFKNRRAVLPSGLAIQFPQLHYAEGKDWRDSGYQYWSARYKGFKKIYGAALTENVIQALSRIIITDAMLLMRVTDPDYFCCLQVHDELGYLVPDHKAERCYHHLMQFMTTRPSWAPDVPLAAEGGWGKRYSDVK